MSKSEDSPMTYRVCIEETISQDFEIVADSLEDALEKARAGYRGGELVVESGALSHVQMRVVSAIDEASDEGGSEWVAL